MDPQHTTVLLQEAVDALVHTPDGLYVDGTYGRGGHARLILSRLSARGRLLAIDRDPEAVAHATTGPRRVDDPRFEIEHCGFAELPRVLAARGIERIDGLLLDLGVSSPQIDDPARGFSFRAAGPLDMRMDPTRGESAADFLARASEREIADVIRDYGEARFARAIARALAARRAEGRSPRTTEELAELVARAVRTREPGQNPATRTFQALRIFINRELEDLDTGLAAAQSRLRPGGRLAIIAFHSLEDRAVKRFIALHAKPPAGNRRMPVAPSFTPTLRIVADAVTAGDAELSANPRARSAVLRVAEKLS